MLVAHTSPGRTVIVLKTRPLAVRASTAQAEVRFDSDTIELVIRPELRRMVAALASPAIAVEMSQERDDRGRWLQEDATLKVVDMEAAALQARRPPRD